VNLARCEAPSLSYENPQVPHQVNAPPEPVLGEFLRIALGLCVMAAAIAALLYFFGGTLARLVPYSYERELVGDRVLAPIAVAARNDAPATSRKLAYLQALADDLAPRANLPAAMRPVVHWSDTDVPNAFATLGGHVVVTRGLYERMPSENALALVIGHELAHLRERDPISAVGGALSLTLVMVLLGADASQFYPQVAHAVQLGYSRRVESRADEIALQAVIARYGHAGGTAAVFEVFADYAGPLRDATPELLATHPADAARIARMRRAASDWNPERQPLRPLAVPAHQ
jgi:beta-barrel assembly-enhancing protease